MLLLLLKNAKDSSLAESSCLTLALATHTEKIKSFDGKRGGSHEMLISDVCHNYQFLYMPRAQGPQGPRHTDIITNYQF